MQHTLPWCVGSVYFVVLRRFSLFCWGFPPSSIGASPFFWVGLFSLLCWGFYPSGDEAFYAALCLDLSPVAGYCTEDMQARRRRPLQYQQLHRIYLCDTFLLQERASTVYRVSNFGWIGNIKSGGKYFSFVPEAKQVDIFLSWSAKNQARKRLSLASYFLANSMPLPCVQNRIRELKKLKKNRGAAWRHIYSCSVLIFRQWRGWAGNPWVFKCGTCKLHLLTPNGLGTCE